MGNIFAGVKRININPPIGIKRPGIRLFADPIQSIESDLTATALVLKHNDNKIAIIACDLAFIPIEDDKNWPHMVQLAWLVVERRRISKHSSYIIKFEFRILKF